MSDTNQHSRLRAAVMGTPAEAELDALIEQLEAAEGLRRAALHVGMWGASYHEALAEAVKRYEAVSSPASEPEPS